MIQKKYLILAFSLLMAGSVFGASALEQQFYSNTIDIFGGNQLLVGLMAMGIFMAAIAFTRIPVVIVAPIYMAAFLIIAYASDTFRFVAVLIAGLAFGAFIYSVARGNL